MDIGLAGCDYLIDFTMELSRSWATLRAPLSSPATRIAGRRSTSGEPQPTGSWGEHLWMSQEVLKIIGAYLVNYYGFKVVEDDDEACCSEKKRCAWLGCCLALGGSCALHPGRCLLLLGKVLLEIESLTAIKMPFAGVALTTLFSTQWTIPISAWTELCRWQLTGFRNMNSQLLRHIAWLVKFSWSTWYVPGLLESIIAFVNVHHMW